MTEMTPMEVAQAAFRAQDPGICFALMGGNAMCLKLLPCHLHEVTTPAQPGLDQDVTAPARVQTPDADSEECWNGGRDR